MSLFDSIQLLPEDPIMHLPQLFAAEKNPNKVNLGIGSYKDSHGQPLVFGAVREAEKILLQNQPNKEYPPIEGNQQFIDATLKLIFSEELLKSISNTLFAQQTVGGTCALRVAGEFLAHYGAREIYLPSPTWPNHNLIFQYAYLNPKSYPYYNSAIHAIEFDSLLQSLDKMKERSVVLLQASCHNPTGVDLSSFQWEQLSIIIKKKRLIPLFDFAYQGFGEGIEQDALAVRLFAQEQHEMFVAYSFAKNFGLYGERVGLLAVIAKTPEARNKMRSHLKQLARSNYSVPPLHGARIVSTILHSEVLTQHWREELSAVCNRIKEMREALVTGLMAAGVKKDMNYLKKQIGMFSFTDLAPAQVQYLREQYGIYLAGNGRANIAGLNHENLQYVITALADVIQVASRINA